MPNMPNDPKEITQRKERGEVHEVHTCGNQNIFQNTSTRFVSPHPGNTCPNKSCVSGVGSVYQDPLQRPCAKSMKIGFSSPEGNASARPSSPHLLARLVQYLCLQTF